MEPSFSPSLPLPSSLSWRPCSSCAAASRPRSNRTAVLRAITRPGIVPFAQTGVMRRKKKKKSMPQRATIEIRNETRDSVVCSSGRIANTFMLRLFGLLGKKGLGEQDGLLITPSSGVHTFGMAFAIDIVSLDRHNRVIGLWEKIGPCKVRGLSRRTHGVLELPPGRIARCGLSVGDELAFGSAAD